MPSRPVTAPFDLTKDSPITTTTWTSLQARSKNQRKTDTNGPGPGSEMENPRQLWVSGAWVKNLAVDVHGRDCSDVDGCTNAAGAGMRRSGLQPLCISSVSTIARALFYLPTSVSVAWRSDVLVPQSTRKCGSGPLLALSSLRDPAALESQG